jgi:hypothetical protein
VYQYIDKREAKDTPPDAPKRKARIAAHREIELLSHAFTKAVEWATSIAIHSRAGAA